MERFFDLPDESLFEASIMVAEAGALEVYAQEPVTAADCAVLYTEWLRGYRGTGKEFKLPPIEL